jgi:asparagine N-glycosylation enzyme membrane subunit Stt3
MRKRAERKSISKETIEKTANKKIQINNKLPNINKNMWVAVSLVAIFFMVLFLNSYFNIASGTPFNDEASGLDRYYLSGPDPYYNMRLVQQTVYGEDPGVYPYLSDKDPLLNYPLGRSGGRKPLMNMMAIMTSQFLTPFMKEVDALGYAMQFVPALFGALLIFPVYFIGKELFGRKIGLLAALLVAIIPIHLGSGHGSAYGLFDHDSFNLFLIVTTYYFLLRSIREKDSMKSMLYAVLGGLPLAGLSMVWVEARFLYTIIAAYGIIQMIVDIFTSKINIRIPRSLVIILFTGYLVSLPVTFAGSNPINLELFLCLGIALLGALYYLFDRQNIPWTLSLPVLFILGAGSVIFVYFVPMLQKSIPAVGALNKINEILFGTGIYGNKVSDTIAEAGTYGISRTVMSFGPALFWIAWIGFFIMAYFYIVKNHRRDHLFILFLFIIQIWFIGVAGRFINDLVLPISLLSAWLIWFIIDKIDYSTMIRAIRASGGGLHGLRRGVKFLHIFGILFIAFIVVLPNAYLSLDAAVPAASKDQVFGDLPNGAFGSSFGKEAYWINAYEWFAQQDNQISDPTQRPAYISWWDYGFYEVAVGGHPTVADNFQDGIPPASNFHTATSEKEAISIWIVRLLEGDDYRNGQISSEVSAVLNTYLESNDTSDITNWVENPTSSPSYGTLVAKPVGEVSKEYTVGEQWPANAVYHDVTNLLAGYTDDTITMLYRDIQDVTGTSIRYYGVEGYDEQIFNIFGYLADKSLLLVAGVGDYAPQDEFVEVQYVTQNGQQLTYEEVLNRTDSENKLDPIVDTTTVYKDPYFETMFYRTYIGVTQTDDNGQKTRANYQIPCSDMKHFYARFISPYPEYAYSQGAAAVVIAKYYEGAIINGSILFNGKPQDLQVVTQQNITQYGTQIPVDHDKNVSVNGTFQVLAPEGDIRLQLRRYPELGVNAFILRNVSFNPDKTYPFTSITENEATRSGDYRRSVDLIINPGEINGTIYRNVGAADDVYNESVDQPIPDCSIVIYPITALDATNGQPTAYDFENVMQVQTDENGFYNASGLLPGYYQLLIMDKDGFQIKNILVPVYEGGNTFDFARPETGGINGVVYFDENNNGAYDSGEELSDVTADLVYATTGTNKVVDTLITDATGQYAFDDYLPGAYQIQLTKLPLYAAVYNVTISENTTIDENLSVNYIPINVSGAVINSETNQNAANATITFSVDTTVVNNTAIAGTATSSKTGHYAIYLNPGTYNVSVRETVNVSGTFGTYVFSSTLVVAPGEEHKSLDIMLTKIE